MDSIGSRGPPLLAPVVQFGKSVPERERGAGGLGNAALLHDASLLKITNRERIARLPEEKRGIARTLGGTRTFPLPVLPHEARTAVIGATFKRSLTRSVNRNDSETRPRHVEDRVSGDGE